MALRATIDVEEDDNEELDDELDDEDNDGDADDRDVLNRELEFAFVILVLLIRFGDTLEPAGSVVIGRLLLFEWADLVVALFDLVVL